MSNTDSTNTNDRKEIISNLELYLIMRLDSGNGTLKGNKFILYSAECDFNNVQYLSTEILTKILSILTEWAKQYWEQPNEQPVFLKWKSNLLPIEGAKYNESN